MLNKILIIIFILCLLIYIERRHTTLEIIYPKWFENINKFPTDVFGCKDDCYNYYKTIYNGIERMKSYRVVFCGLCHNIEKKIPNLIKRIEYTGNTYKDYAMVIFENDSTDNTRKLLTDWAISNDKVKIIPCDEDINCKLKRKKAISTGALSSGRMKYMSEYRDRINAYVRAYYHNYDYVISFDLDVKGPWMMEGFAHTFGLDVEWDAIFAYGLSSTLFTLHKPIYYDSIAYRSKRNEIAVPNTKDKFDNFDVFKNNLKNLYSLSTLTNKDLIPVNSAYAGIGIYKMDIIRNKDINYIPKDGIYLCEHIIYHNNMQTYGYDKLFINPYLVLLAGGQGRGST